MKRRPQNSPRPQTRSRSPGADKRAGEQETASAQRLQKVLAAAGVASRRDCEELIREGRVEVDRKVVTEMGTRVDPVAQEIRVDGESLRKPKRVYFALNKPEDVVCTNHDPSGRTRVIDLVPSDERVFAVGRLDRASEGLILVTNDGLFANHITHPRYGVEKTYLVRVAGRPGPEELAKLRRGVHLAEGFCKVESVVVKSRHKQSSDLLIVLDEGRNREIRRILAKVGHKVVKLKRISIGGLKLGALEIGEWRKLTPAEIESLLAISRKKREKKKVPPKPPEPEAIDTDATGEPKPYSRNNRPPKVATKVAADAHEPIKVKPPSAKIIAAKLLAGKDFEDDDDEDEDFEEDLHGEDFGDEDDDDLDDLDDDDDGEIHARVIREEITDDESPPRSGPAPRGEVIDFDEDSPPPLQPKKVREPSPARRNERSPPQLAKRNERPPQGERPLRAEPRTDHRRRGYETARPGQNLRRGQRHRQEEGADSRSGRPGRPPRPEPGRNPRREKPASGAPRSEERVSKPSLPKRPGKLVVDRPQEDRGARGKFPGKSFGKGKKHEGGGRGAKTIFGKRVKKKGRGKS